MSSDGGLWPDGFKKYMSHVDWQRIESQMTGGGIPDLNGCHRGCDVWVELKFTDAWAVAVRPEQVGWAERRIRAGGRVYLATRRKNAGGPRRGPAADELWLHYGAHIRHVKDLGLERAPPPILRCGGGPSSWDWTRVSEILFG